MQAVSSLLGGQLRDKKDKPFKFDVYSDRRKNQDRYERLGEVLLHFLSVCSLSCILKQNWKWYGMGQYALCSH